MYFQMILVNRDPVYHEFQIIALHLGLVQQIIEYFKRGLGRAVDLDDRVAFVGQQFDLVIQTVDLALQLRFHFVIKIAQRFLVLRVLHNVADTLPLGSLEFCRQVVQHLRRAVHHTADVQTHKLVQLVHADVVAGAARSSAAMVGAAGIRRSDVRTAHREHRCAAVAALKEA